MALPSESYFRMNTAHDLLMPCPICGKNRDADAGHKVCRVCEGVESDPDASNDGGQ
jgi:hypothetical protein